MEDLGQPTSYLTLQKGVPVYSSDGATRPGGAGPRAPNIDIFDGIVLDTTALPGGHRFVDGPEVGEIYERGVVLKIDAAEAERLPPPGANPAAMSVNPADLVGGGRRGALGRAWDKLSGKG